ncbi:MAG TPA: hypothetical protein PLX79_02130 [Candidatus Dojkabacteria bacterium]|nr:hypothetical protein [Candidatus Dojkabacteria bacterium]
MSKSTKKKNQNRTIRYYESLNNAIRGIYLKPQIVEKYLKKVSINEANTYDSKKIIDFSFLKSELETIFYSILLNPLNIIIAIILLVIIIVLSPNRYDFVTAFYYFIGYIWIANDLKPFTLSIISLIALIPVPILLAFKIEFVAEAFASAFYTFLTISLIGIIIQQAKLALAKRNSRE